MPASVPRPTHRKATAAIACCAAAAACALAAAPAIAATSGAQTARAASTCADASLMPSSTDLARIAAATLCLINQQRAAARLPALRSNAALNTAASQHSLDMVAKNYFDHTSPSGSTMLSRLTAVGYIKPNKGWSIGENIAAATGSLATPAAIVTSWMSSPGHRANILSPTFKDTGIGAAAGVPQLVGQGAGGTYTEDFAVTS
ncbi:MAG TPA: CAP domain-containing protein [Solirubrobacteraceae bacterium]|jgi:uncharacterized protein YkwD|nr:CAP domain-containing protein [Solirubrobacteraceae bacterium]